MFTKETGRFAWVVLAVPLFVGCSSQGGEAPAACVASLKYDGSVYAARTTAPPAAAAEEVGEAIVGVCSDVEDPGLAFPADGESITVSALKDVPVKEAFVARGGEGGLQLFIAEGVSESRVAEIKDAMTEEPPGSE